MTSYKKPNLRAQNLSQHEDPFNQGGSARVQNSPDKSGMGFPGQT